MAEVKRQVVITLDPEEHGAIISGLNTMMADDNVPLDYQDFALMTMETLSD